ncbi:MAG: anthranilate synthase component I [Thermodesulfobacteriota bacterium]
MLSPTRKEFEKLTKLGNLIPISAEVHFDWETPLSAYRKIADDQFSFLLESVEGGEKWGRYSFLGSSPSFIFRSRGEDYEILQGEKIYEQGRNRDPLQSLQNFLAKFQPVKYDHLPRFFGGAVGYVAYDMVRRFEKIPEILPGDLSVYDCFFMITDTLLVFDNVRQKMQIISNAFLDDDTPPQEAYERAEKKIAKLISKLRHPWSRTRKENKNYSLAPLSSNLSPGDFQERVKKAKEYIEAGDIIQVVLSQRFVTEISVHPFDIYRALRSLNPSPYLFYLHLNDLVFLGASPEVMVRLEGKQIELRPLAGTRRRGQNKEEDLLLEKELLADEKERAEHIMLVDLGRNDVGRVAQIGTVAVTELMGIERYSHVMHIVSNVRGLLAPGKNCFDVFRAAFPAGTVAGAPKIRAMEIIEELEPIRRGLYAGAVGYFSFSGNLDTCIAIRSILIKEGKAYIQTGAGIVADSDPQKEYEETINKAQALFRAIQIAQEGLENDSLDRQL